MRLLIWPVLVIGITLFIVQNKIEVRNEHKELNRNYPVIEALKSVFTSHAFKLIEDHEIGDMSFNHAVFSHPLCENPVIVLEFKILHTVNRFIDRLEKDNRKLVYYYFDKTYDRHNRLLLYFHCLVAGVKYSLGMTGILPLKSVFAVFYQDACAPLQQLPWSSIWAERQYQQWLQTNG